MPKLLTVVATLCAAASLAGCEGERVGKLEQRIDQLEKKLADARFKTVTIVDEKGAARATLGLRDDGTPHLEFLDATGKNRVLLRLQPDGSPVLVMFGKDVAAPPPPPGKTKDAKPQASPRASAFLAVHGEGPPQLMMFDKSGTQTWRSP